MFISFSNGSGSACENSLIAVAYPFASVPARCTKTTLLETWKRRRAETLSLSIRHDWAILRIPCRWFHERRGSTLTWTVCTAADSEERQICTTLSANIRGERWIVKVGGLMLSNSPIMEHTTVWEGLGEERRFAVAVKHQGPAAKTTNSNCCDRAVAQVKQQIPEQPGWKNSKYWANIEKRNQINTKNYWK